MKKGNENVRPNSSSSQRPKSKLGKFVSKRKSKRDFATPAEQSTDSIANDIERINDIVTNDTFDTDNGIVSENFESGSGSRGSDGSGRSGRSGRDTGSGRDRDNPATDNRSGKRGRRSKADIIEGIRSELDVSLEEAEKIYADQRAPRKVKASELVSDGLTGSVLLLSSLFEGGAELLAMASTKDYLKLQRDESSQLSKAVIDLMESWPASTRKRFDKIMKLYIPYWNLAKVISLITYPRWQIYQMEKELNGPNTKTQRQTNSQTPNSNVHPTEPITNNSEGSDYDDSFQNFGD